MKIVVGYDGSNAGRDALILAVKHAEAFGAEVSVIRSMEGGGREDAEAIRTAQKDLAYAQERFDREGVTCETHMLVRGLSPGEDIVKFAEDNGADEIIVGVRRRSRVGKALFGSVSQYVILEAPCPVVSIK
jgi:nucleotide-binding universal stress UspA family protein